MWQCYAVFSRTAAAYAHTTVPAVMLRDDKDLQQAITLSNQVQTGFIAACISGTVYCHNQSAAAAKIAQEEDDEENIEIGR